MSEVSRFPVNNLESHYNIGKTAVYARLEAARIKPTKEGRRSYITLEDLEELDRLDAHLRTGGSFEGFEPKNSEGIVQWEEPEQPFSFRDANANGSAQGEPTVEVLIGLIERLVLRQLPPVSPLAQYEELEKIAAAGWIVPSSVVKAIVGVNPKGDASGNGKAERYTRGSFTFIRSGKIGREAGWRVQKSTL